MTVIFQKYFSKVWTDQISGKKIGMKKKKQPKPATHNKMEVEEGRLCVIEV